MTKQEILKLKEGKYPVKFNGIMGYLNVLMQDPFIITFDPINGDRYFFLELDRVYKNQVTAWASYNDTRFTSKISLTNFQLL